LVYFSLFGMLFQEKSGNPARVIMYDSGSIVAVFLSPGSEANYTQ
jgi:hypothetical protein